MSTARSLVLACHPIPTLGVTVIAAVLSAGLGLPAGEVVLLVAAVLTGQLSIGWSNDAIDARRDRAAARTDKPTATGVVGARTVAVAAGVALVATVVLSVLLRPAAAATALTLVAAGWAYNLGLKATPASALAYAVGFGAFPAAPYLQLHRDPPWWVPVVGALLGVAAHVANVLPDLDDDRAAGVRGLPQRLGARRSIVALAALLAATAVVLAVGPRTAGPVFTPVVAGLGVLGAAAIVAVARRTADRPLAFRLTLLLALFDVAVVVSVATL
ncbi:MAG: UbiA family prenyltransferase [Jatrophihabitans sp.]|uniref:UbiA family prenyltransferase n=1 Tax=Jatrophihabitans sp. TaxID=1932789 RepID=UPI003F7F4EC3